MFVTKKTLEQKIQKIYQSIKFNRDDAISNARHEVQIKDILPIFKELDKLESRIGELEKQIESENRKSNLEKIYK